MKPWRPPLSPRAARARIRRISLVIGAALACYIMAYVAFSTAGQYVATRETTLPDGTLEPAYEWAPGEFYDYTSFRWQRSHVIVFYPLFWLDNRFWHSAEAMASGRYPVLTLPPGG